jgi:hypothetical protein
LTGIDSDIENADELGLRVKIFKAHKAKLVVIREEKAVLTLRIIMNKGYCIKI